MNNAATNPYAPDILEMLGLSREDLPKFAELDIGRQSIGMLLKPEHEAMASELKRLKNFRAKNGAYWLFSIPHEHGQVLAEIRQKTGCSSQFDAGMGAP